MLQINTCFRGIRFLFLQGSCAIMDVDFQHLVCSDFKKKSKIIDFEILKNHDFLHE
jgi:hypothetical protein